MRPKTLKLRSVAVAAMLAREFLQVQLNTPSRPHHANIRVGWCVRNHPANTSDFDIGKHAVATADLLGIDRFARVGGDMFGGG